MKKKQENRKGGMARARGINAEKLFGLSDRIDAVERQLKDGVGDGSRYLLSDAVVEMAEVLSVLSGYDDDGSSTLRRRVRSLLQEVSDDGGIEFCSGEQGTRGVLVNGRGVRGTGRQKSEDMKMPEKGQSAVDAMEKETRSLHEGIEDIRETLGDMKDGHEKVDVLQENFKRMEGVIDELASKYSLLEDEKKGLDEAYQDKVRRHDELLERFEGEVKERENAEAKVKTLRERMSRTLRRQEKELSESEKEELQAADKAVEQLVDGLRGQVKDLTRTFRESARRSDKLDREVERSELSCEELEREVANGKRELSEMKRDYETQLRRLHGQVSEGRETDDALESAEKLIEGYRVKISEYEAEIEAVNKAKNEAVNEVKNEVKNERERTMRIESERTRARREISEMKRDYETKLRRLRGQLSERRETEDAGESIVDEMRERLASAEALIEAYREKLLHSQDTVQSLMKPSKGEDAMRRYIRKLLKDVDMTVDKDVEVEFSECKTRKEVDARFEELKRRKVIVEKREDSVKREGRKAKGRGHEREEREKITESVENGGGFVSPYPVVPFSKTEGGVPLPVSLEEERKGAERGDDGAVKRKIEESVEQKDPLKVMRGMLGRNSNLQ